MTLHDIMQLLPILASTVGTLFALAMSILAWRASGHFDLKKTFLLLKELKDDAFEAYDLLTADEQTNKEAVKKKVIEPQLKQIEILKGKPLKKYEKETFVNTMLHKFGFGDD